MKLFEFIYYCIYSVIVSIKDIKEKQEKLAVELYFLPLFFNGMMLFLPLIVISSLIKTVSIPFFFIAIIISTMLFGLMFYSKYYFITKNNCERIIQFYQPKIKNKTALTIAVLYFILSFLGMVVSSELSSKIRQL